MNFTRIALAALGAFVAYFVFGGLSFAVLPWLKNEFLKYPAVYRTQEGIKSVMPAGMAFMFCGGGGAWGDLRHVGPGRFGVCGMGAVRGGHWGGCELFVCGAQLLEAAHWAAGEN